MSTAARIAQLEAEVSADREAFRLATAKLAASQAELDALRSGIALPGELTGLSRTDAILQVLRTAGQPLSPSEVLRALRAGGRDEDLRSVTATITYVMDRGDVERVARARYVAIGGARQVRR